MSFETYFQNTTNPHNSRRYFNGENRVLHTFIITYFIIKPLYKSIYKNDIFKIFDKALNGKTVSHQVRRINNLFLEVWSYNIIKRKNSGRREIRNAKIHSTGKKKTLLMSRNVTTNGLHQYG